MFKNHIKIAYRNFLRYKGNTAINIVGLALGISIFLLIIQYVIKRSAPAKVKVSHS